MRIIQLFIMTLLFSIIYYVWNRDWGESHEQVLEPWFKSWPNHVSTAWPLASYLTHVGFWFLAYKSGNNISYLTGYNIVTTKKVTIITCWYSLFKYQGLLYVSKTWKILIAFNPLIPREGGYSNKIIKIRNKKRSWQHFLQWLKNLDILKYILQKWTGK